MRRIILTLVALIFQITAFATVYTVNSVPNPKQNGNFYVSNPDGIISQEDENLINGMLQDLEIQTSNQVAVVVLQSIGDEDPKNFATDLFNYWRLGKYGKDNGLLVLLIKDVHRVEIETGYGLEAILPDAICKSIEVQEMVPFFKQDKYGEGIIKGVEVMVNILKQPDNKALVASYKEDELGFTLDERSNFLFYMELATAFLVLISFWIRHSRNNFAHLEPKIKGDYPAITMGRWIFMYVVLPIGFYFALTEIAYSSFLLGVSIAFYCYLVIAFTETKLRRTREILKYPVEHDIYKGLDILNQSIVAATIFMPIPYLFYYFWLRSKKNYIRNHDRQCPKCSNQLLKLDENKDDAYLEKNQIMEEELKSVDYDVWFCRSCNYHSILVYKNLSSKYKECENCKTIALGFLRDETITAATYTSSGLCRRTYECKFCKKQKTEEYTIARLEHSSSSSSSSSSGSSSGSWGGGSSGGGGAGSSW